MASKLNETMSGPDVAAPELIYPLNDWCNRQFKADADIGGTGVSNSSYMSYYIHKNNLYPGRSSFHTHCDPYLFRRRHIRILRS
jgi:hypothetical protein